MTPTMSTWCSNQLSYNPMLRRNIAIIAHCHPHGKRKMSEIHFLSRFFYFFRRCPEGTGDRDNRAHRSDG